MPPVWFDNERKQSLEDVPGWSWDPRADQWNNGFNHLVEYVEMNGTARPSRQYYSPDGYPLGRWLEAQRAAHRTRRLAAERVQRLNQYSDWL